jgi:predicted RNA-binding Zn-ribbon protein involved in translation (DUF1610 family)
VFELVANPARAGVIRSSAIRRLVEADLRDGGAGQRSREIYGVIVGDPRGTPRATSRAESAATRGFALAPTTGGSVRPVPVNERGRVIEGVALVTVEGVAMFACVACGQLLGDASRTYRLGSRELDIELTDISELFTSPLRETGEQLVFRRYLCPSCGAGARWQRVSPRRRTVLRRQSLTVSAGRRVGNRRRPSRRECP